MSELDFDVSQGIATITLNRPDKRNAFNTSMLRAWTAALEESQARDDVRAIVQTGGLPTDYITPQQVPGFFRGDDLQGTIRDALINGTTTSDAIVFFRELLFTNSAAAVAQATATTGATGLKPESAITFEFITILRMQF